MTQPRVKCTPCAKIYSVPGAPPGSILKCKCGANLKVEGTPEISLFEAGLQSDSPLVRKGALLGLLKHFPREARPRVERLLEVEQVAGIRSLARRAIDQLRRPSESSHVTDPAAEESAQHPPQAPQGAASVNCPLTSENEDDRVREILRIGKTADKTQLSTLRELIETDSSTKVLATAIKVLGRIGGESDASIIATFLSSPDSRVRANAVEGLGVLSLTQVHPGILRALLDPDNRVRANAVAIVSRVDPELALQALDVLARSTDPSERDSAMHICGQLGTAAVLPLLEMGICDENASVRTKARDGLHVLAGKGNDRARCLWEEQREAVIDQAWSQALEDFGDTPDVANLSDERSDQSTDVLSVNLPATEPSQPSTPDHQQRKADASRGPALTPGRICLTCGSEFPADMTITACDACGAILEAPLPQNNRPQVESVSSMSSLRLLRFLRGTYTRTIAPLSLGKKIALSVGLVYLLVVAIFPSMGMSLNILLALSVFALIRNAPPAGQSPPASRLARLMNPHIPHIYKNYCIAFVVLAFLTALYSPDPHGTWVKWSTFRAERNSAMEFASSNDHAQAIQHFQKAAEIYPLADEAKEVYAKSLLEQADQLAGRKALKADSLFKQSESVWPPLSSVVLQRKRGKLAKRLRQDALDLLRQVKDLKERDQIISGWEKNEQALACLAILDTLGLEDPKIAELQSTAKDNRREIEDLKRRSERERKAMEIAAEKQRREQQLAAERQKREQESAEAQAKAAEAALDQQFGDRIDAIVMAKEFVKKNMNFPEEADFDWFQDHRTVRRADGVWAVWGEVTGKNAFGVKIRSKWKVMLRKADKDTWRSEEVLFFE